MADISALRALRELWLDTAGIAALIDTRLYRGKPSEKAAKPHGYMSGDDDDESYTMDGSAGISFAYVAVTWVAETGEGLDILVELARLAATGTRDTITIGSDSFTFKLCHKAVEGDEDVSLGAGSDTVVYARSQEWRIGRAVSTS